MKILFAAALLLGLSSFTAAHAEWEILDSGSAVYAGATTSDNTSVAGSSSTTDVAQANAASK
ncbi:MAG TPA: hypothetical protein VE397_09315 [Stellaceae bacterium]|nr:hypothetical protein [Stellaceae bacterium]